MLKILFCLNCCGAPPRTTSGRTSRSQSVSISRQSQAAKKSIENRRLNNLGSFNHLTSVVGEEKVKASINREQTEESGDRYDSQITQVTSLSNASLSLEKSTLDAGKSLSNSTLNQSAGKQAKELGSFIAIDNENSSSVNTFDEQSSVSSIDTDQKTENSYVRQKLTDPKNPSDQEKWYRNMTLDTKASSTLPSTTRIGDYARLEYSPVDDLDSLTTVSRSRVGSELGAGSRVLTTELSSSNLGGNLSLNPSEQGIESSSISIASQLSSELEKNLTNILETANSPQLAALDTIGLPLGPQDLNNHVPELTRFSPEPTGAALTSASQDSLSGVSLGSENGSGVAATSLRLDTSNVPAVTGAALVDESTELLTIGDVSFRTTSETMSRDGMSSSISTDTTATVRKTTNPTPTPSEMSGSSSKRRKKLTAKSFLKKFKPVKKKKNTDDSDIDHHK